MSFNHNDGDVFCIVIMIIGAMYVKHYRQFFYIYGLVISLFWPVLGFADEGLIANQVKAAQIRNFVQFIQWPAENSPKATMKANVCLVGNAPAEMHDIFAKKSKNSSLEYNVIEVSDASSIPVTCHIAFLAGDVVNSGLNKLQSAAVVTVSDITGFVEKGGMVGFETIENKIRFNINQRAFSKAGLKVDAQLLEIANKVLE